MSNLPAWKSVISGGIPPDGSPLYYYSPAPSFNGGGGSGSVAYADSAGTALTASYVDIRGNGITVNYFGSHIQLTGSGGATSISASYALTASYSENSNNAISASHADSASTAYIANIALNAISASYSVYADTANFAKTAESSSYSPYASTASYVPLTYGPGILYDPNFPMAFSASVRSVNGIFPTDGNINTTLVGVTTGTSASLVISSSGDVTASISEGEVWVISNDPTSSNNGRSFIYDEDNTTGVGTWYELAPLDLSVTDARYLKLDAANGPMQGNINMGGYNITAGNLVGTSSWSEKAISASYVNVTGSGIIVNYNGSQIQLTGSSTVIISASVPGVKEQGTLWFNSNDGNTYLQYISPDGNTWIPAATSVGNAFSSSYAQTASVALSVLNAPPAGAIISASNPGAKQSGSLWWNSNDGNLYVQVASPSGSSYVSAVSTLPNGPVSASYAVTSSYAIAAKSISTTLSDYTEYTINTGVANAITFNNYIQVYFDAADFQFYWKLAPAVSGIKYTIRKMMYYRVVDQIPGRGFSAINVTNANWTTAWTDSSLNLLGAGDKEFMEISVYDGAMNLLPAKSFEIMGMVGGSFIGNKVFIREINRFIPAF